MLDSSLAGARCASMHRGGVLVAFEACLIAEVYGDTQARAGYILVEQYSASYS